MLLAINVEVVMVDGKVLATRRLPVKKATLADDRCFSKR
jgi:hypothetical protein